MSRLPRLPKYFHLLFFTTVLVAALPTQAQLSFSPRGLSFGNVTVGSSAALPMTMTNSGSTAITINKRMKTSRAFSAEGMRLPITLYAGQSVNFTVYFKPNTTGFASATFTLITSISKTYTFTVSGTGVGTGVGALSPNPSTVSFGTVQVGTTKSALQSITNSGSASVTISQASVTGTGFGMTGMSLPLSLAAGQSVTFSLSFTPQSGSTASGNLAIVSNASNATINVPLTGSGSAPGQLSLAPPSINFGSVVIGTSQSQTASLSASGSSVTVSSGTLNNSEFSVSGIALPMTLAPGQSTSFTLTFTPNATGTAAGNVSFASNATNSPVTQSLSGTGAAAPTHSVSLSWNPDASPVASYNVYRGTAAAGPYSRINSVSSSSTTYMDTAVQGGQTYYYAVTAVNSSGVESGYSNSVQAVIPFP